MGRKRAIEPSRVKMFGIVWNNQQNWLIETFDMKDVNEDNLGDECSHQDDQGDQSRTTILSKEDKVGVP